MVDIIRVTSLKILGVSITIGLSASGHVHDVIRSSVQILHMMRVLRARGMNHTALQAIFRSTVVAKLLHAASAWSGFIKISDRQRVDAFLRRSEKCGYCPPDL
jgi:hypothetical protein